MRQGKMLECIVQFFNCVILQSKESSRKCFWAGWSRVWCSCLSQKRILCYEYSAYGETFIQFSYKNKDNSSKGDPWMRMSFFKGLRLHITELDKTVFLACYASAAHYFCRLASVRRGLLRVMFWTLKLMSADRGILMIKIMDFMANNI